MWGTGTPPGLDGRVDIVIWGIWRWVQRPPLCLQSPDKHFHQATQYLCGTDFGFCGKAANDEEMRANGNANATFRLFYGGTLSVPFAGPSPGLARLIERSKPHCWSSITYDALSVCNNECHRGQRGQRGHPLRQAMYLRTPPFGSTWKISVGVAEEGRWGCWLSNEATEIKWLEGGWLFTSTWCYRGWLFECDGFHRHPLPKSSRVSLPSIRYRSYTPTASLLANLHTPQYLIDRFCHYRTPPALQFTNIDGHRTKRRRIWGWFASCSPD